jgi:hypothetical protein
MTIQPKLDFRLLGTDWTLDHTQTYKATPATNQPDWQEKGKVFVSFDNNGQEPSILLDRSEYKIITP